VRDLIYFDNSATTKPLPEVSQLIYDQLSGEDAFGNPSSLHGLGMKSAKVFLTALQDTARLLSCDPKELVFTSCGTESVNTAISGYLKANPRSGRHVLSTRTEHKAAISLFERLVKEGYDIEYLPVSSNGFVELSALESSIRSDTALISLTHVNNETGAILPLHEVSLIRDKKNRNTKIHIDCTQSLGKLPIRLKEHDMDLASFSGHKIHAVKGVGLLYIRSGIRVQPLIVGGGQQAGLRSGTESPYLASAFALALQYAQDKLPESLKRVSQIKQELIDQLTDLSVRILSPESALPYIVNLSFPNFQSETMLHALEEYGIYVSTVSACSSKQKKVSDVLLEMGIERPVAANAIRISFSRFNTIEEIHAFSDAVHDIYRKYSLN
jgi:cysteine desulfurase